MEAVRFVSPKNEVTDLGESPQADEEKKRLVFSENTTKQSPASPDETDGNKNAVEPLTEYFSSDNKENISKSDVVVNEESTPCAAIPLSDSFVTCEKKLLEMSDDGEKDSGVEKNLKETGKLLQLPKKFKFLNDTISTPPSALREQISILRKEMNEAYEFHDLEIQILKGETKEEPENYAELIEKYATLLDLYTSLKNEYEEFRNNQEKVRDELQSQTVDCFETLCSQIEASDNSLSNASIMSFNTDVKSSTMLGTFIEEETTLLHDVTIQTKDPLSDTDVFKTPKITPAKSTKKLFPQIMVSKRGNPDPERNLKLEEVESAFHDKEKEMKKLEQRLFQIEDLSGILQGEFEKISAGVLKENENLKKNLSNKTEELDTLTQKLITEIVSLNPSSAESLNDSPGEKLLAVFIETIMERCKNMQDKLIMKFNNEKSLWETKLNTLEEENRNLNEQTSQQTTAFEELKKAYERQILESENVISTKNEEAQRLRSYEINTKKIEEDLELAREEIAKLESCKKEIEDRCRSLEKTNNNLRLDLEELKNLYGVTQNENCKLLEQLSEIKEESGKLQELCKQLKQELSEKEDIISSRDEEILNLKNREIKQMKTELAEACEAVLKLKAELYTTEGEKLKFEKRCLELEDTNGTLQTVISTKDIMLKNLESFKASCENEWESMKQEIKEKETIISSLKDEIDAVNNKYCMEVQKVESLNNEINQQSKALEEFKKSYETVEKKLWAQDEEIQALRARESDYRQALDELASAKQTIESLKVELEEVNNKYSTEIQEVESLNDEISQQSKALEELRKSNEIVEETSSVQDELASAKQTIESLKVELETINNKYGIEVQKVESLSDEINQSNRALEEVKKSYETVEKKLWTQDEEIQALRARESDYRQALDELASAKQTIESLKVELETINNKYSMEVQKVESLNVEINQQKQALEELRKSHETTEQTQNEEIQNLRARESDYGQAKDELASAKQTIESLKVELDAINNKYCAEVLKVETLNNKISQQSKALEELRQSNDTAEKTLWAKDEEIQTLRAIESDYRQSQDDLTSAKQTIESLKVELDTINNKYGLELLKVESLNDEINQQNRSLEELRKSYENTEKTLWAKDEEIQTLRAIESDYRQAQDDLASAKQTIESLKAELQAAEDHKKQLKDECLVLEEKIANLCIDLETIKSAHKQIEIENVNLEKMIYQNEAQFKFESLFEILQEGKKALTAALLSKEQTDNVAFELIAEQISSSPETIKLIKIIVEYFNIEWEAKQNVLIENLQNEIKITNERVSEISAENDNLKELYEKVKERLTETESVISSRDEEILKLKSETEVLEQMKNDNEKLLELNDVIKGERLNYEKRCQELEDVNSTLQDTIATKEGILKELEDFKHSCEIEQEKLQQQITTNEEIIANLKEVNEKLNEDKKSLLGDFLFFLEISSEKLKDVLCSEKCLSVDELLSLLQRSESPDETDNRILTQLISPVFDVRSKLLQEWDEEKKQNSALMKELENELSDGKQREEEFRKLCLELENSKAVLETEITTKDCILKDLEDFKSTHSIECVKIKQQIEEKEVIISDLKIELKIVEETYSEKTKKMEKEKQESENRCLELEDLNFNLRSAITNKDATLKELEDFKTYYENDLRDMREQLQEREVTMKTLKSELESVKEEFSENLTKLKEEKINLEKLCSELEEVSVNLQNALDAKEIVLKDLENLKNIQEAECERLKDEVKAKEEVISNLENELVSVKNKWNEEVNKMEDEKLEHEHRCMKLEEKMTDLLSSIATKEKLLLDLEEFKSSHGEECEKIKQRMIEKEEIISKLKTELDAVKAKLTEEVNKPNADNILSGLKGNCEKLKDILGSEKHLNLGKEDLLQLMGQTKSPDTEAVFTELFSAVYHVRTKLLQEWEVQKNNDVRLVKELRHEISVLRREAGNAKQSRDKGGEEDDSIDELSGLEKLRLSSVKDFPKVMSKVMAHVKKIQSRSAELREENEKLDEECDSYAKVIKDLKKEAAMEWKKNNEKVRCLEGEIQRLTDEKNGLDNERQELLGKISKLEEECQRLKSNIVPEGSGRNCGCGVDSKKVNELKRTILVKEQKLMELQELEAQNNSYKSQIEYLKNALDKERKKINEEREKNKKLENEIKGSAKTQKVDRKDLEEKQILEELRMRGSISGGVVQEIVDKEKMRKLSKDVGVLKEICRARYAEIKRLEAENAALKNITTRKNSNQMDSPIRSTGPATRSKSILIEKWKTDMEAKENRAL